MKYADINKIYTEIVAEYIGRGYTINTSSMSGTQGETAKVDLTNGTEVIRVLVQTFHDWKVFDVEGVEIIAGRVTDDVIPNESERFSTVCNDNLEILVSERFYKLGENCRREKFYGTKDEGETAARLRVERYAAKNIGRVTVDLTDKALEIGKRIVRREFGVKRVSAADVHVIKHNGAYIVKYKSKIYRLR